MKILHTIKPIAVAIGIAEPDMDSEMEDFYSDEQCLHVISWAHRLVPVLFVIALGVYSLAFQQ